MLIDQTAPNYSSDADIAPTEDKQEPAKEIQGPESGTGDPNIAFAEEREGWHGYVQPFPRRPGVVPGT
jgi:hypothetical protein